MHSPNNLLCYRLALLGRAPERAGAEGRAKRLVQHIAECFRIRMRLQPFSSRRDFLHVLVAVPELHRVPHADFINKRLADIIRRNARLIGQRRECMPQLMQHDLRQIVIRKKLAEQLRQIIRPERPAVLYHNHIVVIVVGILIFCLARLLILLRRLQHITQRIRQIQCACRRYRFGALFNLFLSRLRARILNRDSLALTINIAPPQTEQFTAPQTEVGTDIHRQLEPRPCHFVQQNA